MKKFLSIFVAVAMLASLVSVFALSVSAAVRGDWAVYADKVTYAEDSAGVRSIPGYEYTSEGLHMIPANWENTSPWGCIQTSDPVDLKQGVYMEVRVDDFSYDADDKWFAFEIWENPVNVYADDDPSHQWNDYGGEMLMRLKTRQTGEDDNVETVFDSLSHINWYTYLKKGERIKTDVTQNPEVTVDEEGRPILTLEIIYNKGNESYSVYVNSAPAPAAFNIGITQYFNSIGDLGYITFSAQNNKQGGTVECTVLKYGTSKDTAETPVGDDREDPIDNNIEFAEIADPDTVPEGDPALILNGAPADSDSKTAPSSFLGSMIVVNDDSSMKMYSNAQGETSLSLSVDDDVSYDAKDFPIMAIITKNFCTCTDPDSCDVSEYFDTYMLAGSTVQASEQSKTSATSPTWIPDYVGEDSYRLLIADWSGCEGRIHGFRIDNTKMQTKEGSNFLEICEILFFRTDEEAKAYYGEYIAELKGDEVITPDETGSEDNSEDETEPSVGAVTEDPNADVTEAPTAEVTEAPTAEITETPTAEVTESPTAEITETPTAEASEAPTAEVTEAPASETTENDPATETEALTTDDKTEAVTDNQTEASGDDTNSDGCGGMIGVGTLAVVVAVTVGFASFRKKDD